MSSFYVGNQGDFDYLVIKQLKLLKQQYTEINIFIVLAYMPTPNTKLSPEDLALSILPDNQENIHPKFAINKRNQWMVEQADYVITYVKYPMGGAAKFKNLAQRKGKTIIELSE